MTNNQSNEIKVGNKPFMSYIRSIELLLRKRKMKNIVLKARGKNIKTAIDIAEASKNKFLDDLHIEIEEIKTSTSNFEDNDRQLSVSCIEIKIISK